eukprot:1156355-Pelagomonas_calceolata.AAC.15
MAGTVQKAEQPSYLAVGDTLVPRAMCGGQRRKESQTYMDSTYIHCFEALPASIEKRRHQAASFL